MTFTRGDDEYRLSLQIFPCDDGGFFWEISVAENRNGSILQSRERSAGSFDTSEEAEGEGKAQLLKMFKKRPAS